MFAKTIIDSDAFLDMPVATQCLYFHLGMRADDDGVIANPKSIMRICGAREDDMNLLIAKKFILVINNQIIVIKHWKINNYIQKDRYKQSNYYELISQLSLDENNAYTMRENNDVYIMDTQVSIGKDSIGKDSIEQDNDIMSVSEETNIKVLTVFSTWNQCKSVIKHKEVTDVRKKAIEKALKNYKVEAIIAAINHYDIILASKWYFKYKWSLEDFLNQKNAMPTFMDEGSNWCSFNEDLKKNPYLIPQAEPQREVSQSVKDFLKSIK